MYAFDIKLDDLSSAQTRGLLAIHLAGMHASSPPGHVFALDLSGLQRPDVTVWSVWRDHEIAAIGALRDLGGHAGELKSMRTHPDYLRRGAAATLLRHLIAEARARGMTRLCLETGSGPAFAPALALYRKHGFEDGGVFAEYERSAFNQFCTWRFDLCRGAGVAGAAQSTHLETTEALEGGRWPP